MRGHGDGQRTGRPGQELVLARETTAGQDTGVTTSGGGIKEGQSGVIFRPHRMGGSFGSGSSNISLLSIKVPPKL